ncbi:MAG: lipopolysaccharide biosynthesis protein [Rhodospirillaceae bacterium]
MIMNGVAALFPLIAIPVITRTVTPTDYGVYAIFLVGVNILMPLVGLGFETAAGRRYVDRGDTNYAAYITTGLALTGCLAAFVYGALYSLAPQLAATIPVPGKWFWAWVAVAWAQTIIGLILVLHQMGKRPTVFGKWYIGRAFFLNGLLVIFVLSGLAGWVNLITVLVVGHCSFAVAGIIWLWRKQLIVLSLSYQHLKHIVRYGAPLIPHMIGAALVTATDRVLLVNLIDEAAAGIYTIGYQVGLAMFLMSQSVNRAWTPWFYDRMKENSNQSRVRAVTAGYWVALIYIIAGMGFATVGWFVLPFIFGETYLEAMPVFIWIVAAFVAQGLWSLTASYLYYSEETLWVSVSSALAAIFNIGLTYILIQTNGMIGAAQGTFIAYMLGFITVTIVTVRRAQLPWRLRS